MAPKASKGKNTNTGLVVTLVFFILSTIGLGISTYTGYTDSEGKDQKYKKLEAELKVQKDTSEWYEYQSLLFKAYMGMAIEKDHTRLLAKYEKVRSKTLGTVLDEKPDLDSLLSKLNERKENKLGWDEAQVKPSKSYEDLLAERRKENEGLSGQVALLTKQKKDADEVGRRGGEELVAAKTSFNNALTEQTTKVDTERKTEDDRIKQLLADYERLGKDNAEMQKKHDEEIKKERAATAQAKAEVVFLTQKLHTKTAELAQAKLRGSDAPKNWRTDWKIFKLEPDGNLAYINLGSADGVQEQLTFSVHGLDVNQKPLPASKGNVEVLSVVGQHVSQVRVTNVKDRGRDPILEGDVLFNPTWDPTLKKHVAIAGIVDLTGEGRESLQEFKRNLERQGIVVDAWNEKDAPTTIKGKGISFQTDYLIIADGLDYLPKTPSNDVIRKEIGDRILYMKKEAGEHGVQIVGFRHYLEKIGYRLPRGIERTPVYRPVQPLGEPKEMPKNPMPPPDQPKEPPKDPNPVPPGGM